MNPHLGIGGAGAIEELTVDWPAGGSQTFRDLAAGRYYRIVEGREPAAFTPGARTVDP
jgi:hypothetical protein